MIFLSFFFLQSCIYLISEFFISDFCCFFIYCFPLMSFVLNSSYSIWLIFQEYFIVDNIQLLILIYTLYVAHLCNKLEWDRVRKDFPTTWNFLLFLSSVTTCILQLRLHSPLIDFLFLSSLLSYSWLNLLSHSYATVFQ